MEGKSETSINTASKNETEQTHQQEEPKEAEKIVRAEYAGDKGEIKF